MFWKKIIIFLFVKTINPRIKLKYSNWFAFDFNSNTLFYCFDDKDIGFLRHMRECHLWEPQFGIVLYSLLHELGHYFMQDSVASNEKEIRAAFSLVPLEVVVNNEKLQDAYYNLESEFEATEWAIEFSRKHKWICKFLNGLLTI